MLVIIIFTLLLFLQELNYSAPNPCNKLFLLILIQGSMILITSELLFN